MDVLKLSGAERAPYQSLRLLFRDSRMSQTIRLELRAGNAIQLSIKIAHISYLLGSKGSFINPRMGEQGPPALSQNFLEQPACSGILTI